MKKLFTLLLLVFSFYAFAAPAPGNDECNTAQVLARQSGIMCTSTFAATTIDATASSQTAIYNTDKDDDIWFEITLAPGQTEGKIQVSGIVYAGTAVDIVFELWTPDCGTRLPYSLAGGTVGDFQWNLTGLTSGTYKVRAYTNNTSTRASFNICFLAGPINDDCANATMAPVQNGTCNTAAPATTMEASGSSQTAFIPAYADDDVWYKFTTGPTGTAGTVKVVIRIIDVNYGLNTPESIALELRDASGGICNNAYINSTILPETGGSFSVNNLDPSTQYSVRIYTNNNTSRIVSFGFCVFAPVPPANDDCASPTDISLSSNTGFVVQADGTIGASASSQTSGDGSGKDDDVWFSFTTPASALSGQAVISDHSYSTGSGQPVFELWDNCGSSFLAWNFGSLSWNMGGLTLAPSTTYRLRVYTYGSSSRFNTFKVTVNLLLPPPANDTYAGAVTLPLNAGNTCTSAATGGTTIGANQEPGYPACGGATQRKDVWYKFTATKTTALIQLTNVGLVSGSSSTLVMDVFEGSNTGPLKLCSNTGTLDFDASAPGATLTIGTNYFIRVYNQDASSSSTFDLCTRVSLGLTFSNCNNAVSMPVSTDEFCVGAVRLTNVDANKGTLSPGCTVDQWNSIWVKFVAPSNPGDHQLSIQNYQVVTGSMPTFYVSMYSGTCGSLTQINCNIGGLQDIPATLTPGQTYFVNIETYTAASQGNFDVCIRRKPGVPTNAACASAQVLTATSNASAPYVNGTTLGVTVASTQDCFSMNTPNRIVWYKFTATATSHFVDIRDFVQLSSNANGAGIRVRQGTCAALTDLSSPVCVFAVANQNQKITGLTIGNEYFIEVMENTFNGGPVSYKIRVIGDAPPANDESSGAITLVQSPDCTPVSHTLRFSTLSSATAPSGTFSEDVWFKFTAVATSATVSMVSRLAPNPQIALYAADATTLLNDGNFGSATFSSLVIGNVYYLRILNAGTASANPNEDFTICVTGTPASAVASEPTPGSCIQNDNTVTSTNSGTWLHFLKSGNIIASVLDVPGGGGMGAMTAKYFVNTGAVRSDAGGEEYLDRNIDIAPAIQPTNPVTVRLYFSKTEFQRLVGANDGDGNDVYWLNDLKISKFSNLTCQSVIGTTGELLYAISGYGNFGGNAYYLDVIVPSFSSFYVMNTTGVLPVTCGGFNYERKNSSVRLSWRTLTEINASHFEIQRSFNGTEFHKIGMVQANGNPSAYGFVDASAGDNVVYYRLLSVDKDGSGKFACNTIKASVAGVRQPIFGNAYPNPVTNEINVKMNRSYNGNVGLQVIDATGHIVLTRSTVVHPSDSKIRMQLLNLPKGVYALRLQTAEGVETIRFTKH